MFNTKTFATLGFAFIASIVSAACGGASDEAGGGDTGDEQDVTLLKHCGGFAGLTCTASTTTCVDDPSDSCDPEAGGRGLRRRLHQRQDGQEVRRIRRIHLRHRIPVRRRSDRHVQPELGRR